MIGYRTYVVATLTAIFGALAATDWNTFLQDPKAGISIIIMSIIMAAMRSITTTPPANR